MAYRGAVLRALSSVFHNLRFVRVGGRRMERENLARTQGTPFPLRPERILLVAFALLCVAGPLRAQDELPVPPPVQTIANEDRAILTALNKPDDRVKKAVELSEQRLKQAEELTAKQDYQAALEQLGRYQGIIADTLAWLKPLQAQRQRKPFRAVEIALRAQVPRIEVMRRQTPMAYGVHLRSVGEYARNARTEALNAFFDNTVLAEDQAHPESKDDKTKTATAFTDKP